MQRRNVSKGSNFLIPPASTVADQLCQDDTNETFVSSPFSLADASAASVTKLLVVTWNVASVAPPTQLEALFREADSAELCAVCLQEVKMSTGCMLVDGQRRAKETLLSRGRSADGRLTCAPAKENVWEDPLLSALARFGDFFLVGRCRLVGLRLFIFARSCIRDEICDVVCGAVATGSAGLGNKGAVAIGFSLKAVRILVVNSHLASGSAMKSGAEEKRKRDYKRIRNHLSLQVAEGRGERRLRLVDFDAVVWAGDMNSRLKVTKSEVNSVLAAIRSSFNGDSSMRTPVAYSPSARGSRASSPTSFWWSRSPSKESRVESRKSSKQTFTAGTFEEMFALDELCRARNEDSDDSALFSGFSEAPVRFPPTYKFIVGGEKWEYDVGQSTGSGKTRVPAWCDRIFFKGLVSSCKYDALACFNQSDHKPVVAVLEVWPPPRPKGNSAPWRTVGNNGGSSSSSSDEGDFDLASDSADDFISGPENNFASSKCPDYVSTSTFSA